MTRATVKTSLLALSLAATVGGWALLARNSDQSVQATPLRADDGRKRAQLMIHQFNAKLWKPLDVPAVLELPPVPELTLASAGGKSASAGGATNVSSTSFDLPPIPEIAAPVIPPASYGSGGGGGGSGTNNSTATPAPQSQPASTTRTRSSH
jgi:hypothetical protein